MRKLKTNDVFSEEIVNVNSQKYLVTEEEERPTQKTPEPTKIKPKGIKMVKMIVKPIKSLGVQES